MSGHSKWANIKRKKEKTDGAKAKIFTKIGREIMVAAREGGADPSNNSRLATLIAKAKANNVPNDNIDRIIKKAAGGGDKNEYIDIMYEGYGPSGVAVIVECLTDNRNRTAANMRHYFDKYGGNLGQAGCVSYMFTQKGVLVLDAEELDEDKLMEDCFEVGAEDMSVENNTAEITTEPASFSAVREGLEKLGYQFLSAQVEYVPSTYVALSGEENLSNMGKLVEMLEEDDDVQEIWHNLENEEDLP